MSIDIATPLAPALPDLDLLAARLTGPLFGAGDPGLPEEVAPWNQAAAHRPQLVVGAACAADVAVAVEYAAAHDLPVAVQATGHGNVEASTEGLLVTTWRMQHVEVNPATRTARVGAGVKWQRLLAAAAPYGLVGLSGSSSDVGVVGYVLGGGLGSLGRRHGFAADHVVSLEVVTSEGRLRRVSADQHPDLFWALRGGKGGYGVVTEIEIRLFPEPELYGGGLFYDGEHAAAVLHAWARWAPALGEETSTSVAVLRLPDAPFVPPPLRERTSVHLRLCHQGGAEEAERLLAPMRGVAPLLLDDVRTMTYAQADDIHRDPVDPMPVWERGACLSHLPADAVDALLGAVGPEQDTPLFMAELRLLGGALGRPAVVPNAVPGREAGFAMLLLGPYAEELLPVVEGSARALLDALSAYLTGTCLVNFIGHAIPEEVEAAWGPHLGRRLRELKRVWDPERRFRRGHVLRPADD